MRIEGAIELIEIRENGFVVQVVNPDERHDFTVIEASGFPVTELGDGKYLIEAPMIDETGEG